MQAARAPRKEMSRSIINPSDVHRFVEDLVGDDMHAKRVLSLSGGVVGVIHSATLGVHAIGQALATAMGLNAKHAVKQVDRLLSNEGFNVWPLFGVWVDFVLAQRDEMVVALDWTDFDGDSQTTIALHLITSHGRTTPLLWKTVQKADLKYRRNQYEDEIIDYFRTLVPRGKKVTLLADRGFGDQTLYTGLANDGIDYVIRFRQDIAVTCDDETKPAIDWIPPNGRPRMLRDAAVTTDRTPVPAVVVVHAPKMKEPWCLATSRSDLSAADVVKLYGRRFTIEEKFRDLKDPRFGMGISSTHLRSPRRRDRMLFLAAIAQALLTLLGAASEETGLDKKLKVNTVKKRTHSLLRQGTYWFGAIPNMREEWLLPLMRAFGRLLRQHALWAEVERSRFAAVVRARSVRVEASAVWA